MDAKPVTLSEILPGEGQFIIPVFQRFYSWEKDKWELLWDDIKSLIDDDDHQYRHFIGPMIVNRQTFPYDIARYLVVDGQQRLITLTVVLCALRDIAQEHNEADLAAAIVNNYLSFKTAKGQLEYRLQPRFSDRQSLLNVIADKPSPASSEDQITQAYRYFKQVIAESLEAAGGDPLEYLNNLYEAITRRLALVSITLDNSDDPSKIYESMNFKADKLLDADLIRNYVLMQLRVDEQDIFHNTQWLGFETQFAQDRNEKPDTKELEDFYYRYLIAQTNYFPKRKVYYEFRHLADSYIKDENATDVATSLSKLTVSLKRYARYYRAIVHPQLENDQDLRAAFQRFDLLDVKTAIPFLLSLYARYDDVSGADAISKDTFLQLANSLESFVMRRSIMRDRTRGYGADFAQAAAKAQTLQQLWNHFDQRGWPSDDVISDALLEFPLYLREVNKARLTLQQLEESFGHKEQVDLGNRKRITIEHIMPQSLTGEWEEMLGENAHEIHDQYVNTIGNLTLTGYNRELGAKSFRDKKSLYARHGSGTHLELNSYVLQQEQWTEAEITERARQLIERFIQIWPRPETPKQPQS